MPMEDPKKHQVLMKDVESDPPNLFAVKGLHLDESHRGILAEMAAYVRRQLQVGLGEYEPSKAGEPSPNLGRVWNAVDSTKFAEASLEALGRGDLGRYVGLVKDFVKGSARAGRPFVQINEFLQASQGIGLESAVALHQDSNRLKLAIKAVHGMGLIGMMAAAEAYAEIYEAARADLNEALRLARYAWPTLLKTSQLLGLGERLPRLYLRELFSCAACLGLPGLGKVEQAEGRLVHRGPHMCGPECTGEPRTCMTAYAVEAKVELLLQKAVRLQSVNIQPGNICEVILLPRPRTRATAGELSQRRGGRS